MNLKSKLRNPVIEIDGNLAIQHYKLKLDNRCEMLWYNFEFMENIPFWDIFLMTYVMESYHYPPFSFLTGNYFASHFFMGGEKFDTPHPEGYLFGENMDLNFLGNRPVQVNAATLEMYQNEAFQINHNDDNMSPSSSPTSPPLPTSL